MRLTAIFVALFVTAASFAQTIKIESPASLSIPVLADKTVARLRVYYTPKDAKVQLTDIGPLGFGMNAFLDPEQGSGIAGSFTIRIDPKGLVKPGDVYSGSLIFAAANNVTQSFPVTVTRPKPSFTATVLQPDICLGCGEPKTLPVQITNGGSVPIMNLRVGAITMVDAARHHRWTPDAKNQPGGVNIFPGQVKTLALPIDAPYYAGDYATNIEVLANDAQTAQLAAVIRTRGPGSEKWWPAALFVAIVLIGASIAHALEGYFGGGGGAIRDKALVSLHTTAEKLQRIDEWAITWDDAHPQQKLTWTRKRISEAVQEVDDAIADANDVKPEDIQTRAVNAVRGLEKKRVLKSIVEFAAASGKLNKVPELDVADDSGGLDAYKKALDDILNVPTTAKLAEKTSGFLARAKSAVDRLNWRLQTMKWLRRFVLIVVSLATAYVALYNNKCSYGSVMDYITTFFWALGLTQAGNALIAEGTSKYKPTTG